MSLILTKINMVTCEDKIKAKIAQRRDALRWEATIKMAEADILQEALNIIDMEIDNDIKKN